MPRKYFRKYLPTHEAITSNRFIAWFGPLLKHHNLWHLHRRSVSGGVAAGLFSGLIPGPLQILTAVLLSIVFRVNLPVAALMTLYTNPFTIVPLYLLAYQLGELVMFGTGDGTPPEAFSAAGKGFSEWLPALFDWVLSMGKPLAIGLPLLATLLAVVGYFAVDLAWRLQVRHAWRARHRKRHPGAK